MKQRSFALEIMDDPLVSHEVWERFHYHLSRLDRVLGSQGAMIQALRSDPRPVKSVLDIGCANGALMRRIRRELGVVVTGIDLRCPQSCAPDLTILQADAVQEPLPHADVAICVNVLHHLSDQQIVGLIRNVGLTSRRFILRDLVRHRLPLALFRVFMCPLIDKTVGVDGCQSIRRAFTPLELHALVVEALGGSAARFRHWVSPVYASQVIDITWS